MSQAVSVSSFLCYCAKYNLSMNEAASVCFLCHCVKYNLFVPQAASQSFHTVLAGFNSPCYGVQYDRSR